jgi:Ca-activated chloride channel family protein
MPVLCRAASLLAFLGAVSFQAPLAGQDAAPAAQAVFKARVERVPVATVVRTRAGKAITDLKRDDFTPLDNGRQRKITDFQSDPSPINLLLLVDLSGSMGVYGRWTSTLEIAGQLELFLKPREDEVGLFGFDKKLRELAPFGAPLGDVQYVLKNLHPFGVTSLFDAIADAGRTLAARPGVRRAVVVLTDGEDNASRLTPEQVSALASSIDVPVYIVMVASALDQEVPKEPDKKKPGETTRGRLADLAHWTGGELYRSKTSLDDRKAAAQIVAELRQQYLIVFEPDSAPGWHSIVIQTRSKDHVVRTRNGYLVGTRSDR